MMAVIMQKCDDTHNVATDDRTILPSERGVLFAKLEHFSKLFPLNESNHQMSIRNPEKYVVKNSNTERHKRSAVPFLQRLLNEDHERQKKDLRKLFQVNNGIVNSTPIT